MLPIRVGSDRAIEKRSIDYFLAAPLDQDRTYLLCSRPSANAEGDVAQHVANSPSLVAGPVEWEYPFRRFGLGWERQRR